MFRSTIHILFAVIWWLANNITNCFSVETFISYVSTWVTLSTNMPSPLTQYYPLFDVSNNTVYLGGGITGTNGAVSSNFQKITFSFSNNIIEVSETEIISNYYRLLYNLFKADVEPFYATHHITNGVGYNTSTNTFFIYSPHYMENLNQLYLFICDDGSLDTECKIQILDTTSGTDDHDTSDASYNDTDGIIYDLQPCITSNNNNINNNMYQDIVYLVGGAHGGELSNDILYYNMSSQSFLNIKSTLADHESNQGCGICNNALYTFGGARSNSQSSSGIDDDIYTTIIEKCNFVNDNSFEIKNCSRLEDVELSYSSEHIRAVTVGNEYMLLIGGEISNLEYSKYGYLFDCVNDEFITFGNNRLNLNNGIHGMQTIVLTNPHSIKTNKNGIQTTNEGEYYVCMFGGQSITGSSATISDEIKCLQIVIEAHPTSSPTNIPTTIPSTNPTDQPSINPTVFPTNEPSYMPTERETTQQPTIEDRSTSSSGYNDSSMPWNDTGLFSSTETYFNNNSGTIINSDTDTVAPTSTKNSSSTPMLTTNAPTVADNGGRNNNGQSDKSDLDKILTEYRWLYVHVWVWCLIFLLLVCCGCGVFAIVVYCHSHNDHNIDIESENHHKHYNKNNKHHQYSYHHPRLTPMHDKQTIRRVHSHSGFYDQRNKNVTPNHKQHHHQSINLPHYQEAPNAVNTQPTISQSDRIISGFPNQQTTNDDVDVDDSDGSDHDDESVQDVKSVSTVKITRRNRNHDHNEKPKPAVKENSLVPTITRTSTNTVSKSTTVQSLREPAPENMPPALKIDRQYINGHNGYYPSQFVQVIPQQQQQQNHNNNTNVSSYSHDTPLQVIQQQEYDNYNGSQQQYMQQTPLPHVPGENKNDNINIDKNINAANNDSPLIPSRTDSGTHASVVKNDNVDDDNNNGENDDEPSESESDTQNESDSNSDNSNNSNSTSSMVARTVSTMPKVNTMDANGYAQPIVVKNNNESTLSVPKYEVAWREERMASISKISDISQISMLSKSYESRALRNKDNVLLLRNGNAVNIGGRHFSLATSEGSLAMSVEQKQKMGALDDSQSKNKISSRGTTINGGTQPVAKLDDSRAESQGL